MGMNIFDHEGPWHNLYVVESLNSIEGYNLHNKVKNILPPFAVCELMENLYNFFEVFDLEIFQKVTIVFERLEDHHDAEDRKEVVRNVISSMRTCKNLVDLKLLGLKFFFEESEIEGFVESCQCLPLKHLTFDCDMFLFLNYINDNQRSIKRVEDFINQYDLVQLELHSSQDFEVIDQLFRIAEDYSKSHKLDNLVIKLAAPRKLDDLVTSVNQALNKMEVPHFEAFFDVSRFSNYGKLDYFKFTVEYMIKEYQDKKDEFSVKSFDLVMNNRVLMEHLLPTFEKYGLSKMQMEHDGKLRKLTCSKWRETFNFKFYQNMSPGYY